VSSRRWVPLLVFAGLVLFVFWPIWIPGSLRRAFVYDALWEYWGDLQIQLGALSDGSFPLWNPFDRAGYPFHADIQAGTLYPLQWPLIGLAALIGPVQELVSLKILLHYWLLGVGMYLFVRRRGLSPAAGYAAGALVLLGYPFSHAMFSAICWSAAWGPWMMLALDAWGERPTARAGAAVGLVFALSFLAGAPAGFFYAALAALPFGLWRAATSGGSWRAILGTGAVAVLVFLLLTAAQLVATADLMARSVRSVRDLDFIGTTAFTPDDLFGFVVPRMPGEGPYLGILGVLAVALALSVRPRGDTLIFGATAVLAVLLAWGNLGPFLPFAASVAPPFGFFRRAHRFLFTTMLALAPVVAAGWSVLAGDERKRLSRVVLVAGGAAALVFAAGTIANLLRTGGPRGPGIPAFVSRQGAFFEPYALGLVAAVVGAWLAWQVTRRASVWAVVAALFLFFELWLARWPAIQRNWTPLPDVSRDREVLALTDVAAHQVRFMDREYLRFRPGARLGLRDFGGYEDDPLAMTRADRAMREAIAAPRLLGHGNVRYLFEAGRKITAKSPDDEAALVRRSPNLWEVRDVAPFVSWTGNVEVVNGMAAAFERLRSVRPGTLAVVEEGATQTSAIPSRAGRLLALDWNTVSAEIDAPAPGLVVLTEAWYPGWEATVDGAPTPIVVTNGAYRGVRVDAGVHRIELRYRARGYLVLAGVELLTLIAIGLWLGRRR
jgi:hypothetical protein